VKEVASTNRHHGQLPTHMPVKAPKRHVTHLRRFVPVEQRRSYRIRLRLHRQEHRPTLAPWQGRAVILGARIIIVVQVVHAHRTSPRLRPSAFHPQFERCCLSARCSGLSRGRAPTFERAMPTTPLVRAETLAPYRPYIDASKSRQRNSTNRRITHLLEANSPRLVHRTPR
jgi:hypothetical protein